MEIPVTKSITGFFHCALCLEDVQKIVARTGQPQSPATYQRLEVGYTDVGVQVWCRRHDINVAHFDFMELKIPVEIRRS